MILYESVVGSIGFSRFCEGAVFLAMLGFLGTSFSADSGHLFYEEDGLEEEILYCFLEGLMSGLGLRGEAGLSILVGGCITLILEAGFYCYLYPGLCLCMHVGALLGLTIVVVFSFSFCLFCFSFVDFVGLLLTMGVPVWLAPLVAVSQGVGHCARFLTVSLRLALNLIVGHVLIGLVFVIVGVSLSLWGVTAFFYSPISWPVANVDVLGMVGWGTAPFSWSGGVYVDFLSFGLLCWAYEVGGRLIVISPILILLVGVLCVESVYSVFQVFLFGLLLVFYSGDSPLLHNSGIWGNLSNSLASVGPYSPPSNSEEGAYSERLENLEKVYSGRLENLEKAYSGRLENLEKAYSGRLENLEKARKALPNSSATLSEAILGLSSLQGQAAPNRRPYDWTEFCEYDADSFEYDAAKVVDPCIHYANVSSIPASVRPVSPCNLYFSSGNAPRAFPGDSRSYSPFLFFVDCEFPLCSALLWEYHIRRLFSLGCNELELQSFEFALEAFASKCVLHDSYLNSGNPPRAFPEDSRSYSPFLFFVDCRYPNCSALLWEYRIRRLFSVGSNSSNFGELELQSLEFACEAFAEKCVLHDSFLNSGNPPPARRSG